MLQHCQKNRNEESKGFSHRFKDVSSSKTSKTRFPGAPIMYFKWGAVKSGGATKFEFRNRVEFVFFC